MNEISEIILFIISALPVFLIGLYIYKKDRDKEPGRLLTKLFLGGILSCFLTMFISFFLDSMAPFFSIDPAILDPISLFISIFIGVALIEESCKWIILYRFSYNNKAFDELYDMIVYAVFVSLGFAFFENMIYIYHAQQLVGQGLIVGIIRAILSVPGHACFGVFMGYYLGLSKIAERNNDLKLKKHYVTLSIIIPVILHGIYDYCILSNYLIFLYAFFAFIGILFVKALKKVKQIAAIGEKRVYKDNYCPYCGHVVESDYCPMCGRKNF